MCSYCAKYLMFDLKKYRVVIFHDTEEWCKMTWGIRQIFIRALECVKLELWWDPFAQSRKCMSLKFTEESWVMTMLQKLKRNWFAVLKLTWRTSRILTRALESLKHLCFNWLLVTKVYIVWATKVQRSYLSWHWRVMQILKKNWLVVWKMTWEIWQIFTSPLKSFQIGTLMGSFYPK